MLFKVEKINLIRSITNASSSVFWQIIEILWGRKGGENWTYECSYKTSAVSFTGTATSADMSHSFPLADILLTSIMSKHSHILIIFLLLESLSSFGYRNAPLLFSMSLVSPFSVSFASSFSSLHLPLHSKEPQIGPQVSSLSSTAEEKQN